MVAPELLQCYLFFGFLKPEQLKAIADISKEEACPSGALVFTEGQAAEWLYILVKGSVDLFFRIEVAFHPEQGKELLFGTIHPGELFSISALIEPHVLTSSARAAKDCRMIKINAAQLLELCEQDEDFAYGLMQQIVKATIERLNATRLQLASAWATAQA
jgi:CRP-like cAMP-binding protein